MKVCPICNTEYPLEEEFCSRDGHKLYTMQAKSQDPLIGMVFEGRYRVNRLIGEGGMGRVYQATNINAEMEVALKILNRAASQDPGVVKRFEVERRIISRLRHPNILKLLDSFRAETGELVIVIEFVAGETLEEAILGGKLDEAKTLYVLREVFDALTEAHNAGIVHRDLKPSNIMLEQIGDRSLIKILDFGIAKHLGSTGLTAGGTLGTPAYMSPEQIEGADLDGRSDIYSMGIVAYECLTGKPPFDGDNAFSIIRKHIMEQPPSLRGVVPPIEVAPSVEAFITRLLAKAPQDRPVDARAAREEVDALYRVVKERANNITEQLGNDLAVVGDDETLEGVHADTMLPEALLGFGAQLASKPPSAELPEVFTDSINADPFNTVMGTDETASHDGGVGSSIPMNPLISDDSVGDATESQDTPQASMVSAILSASKPSANDPETAPFSVGDLMSMGEDADQTSTNEVASIDYIPLIRDDSISADMNEVTSSQTADMTDAASIAISTETAPLPMKASSHVARNVAIVLGLVALGGVIWFFGLRPTVFQNSTGETSQNIVVGKPAPASIKTSSTSNKPDPKVRPAPNMPAQPSGAKQVELKVAPTKAAEKVSGGDQESKPPSRPAASAVKVPPSPMEKKKSVRSNAFEQKKITSKLVKKPKAKRRRSSAKRVQVRQKKRVSRSTKTRSAAPPKAQAQPPKKTIPKTKKVQAKYDDDLFD